MYGVRYCLYKSLNFLDQDLAGERGDIDVVVDSTEFSVFEACARRAGFRRVIGGLPWPIYFVGRDQKTQKFVMIDVDVCFRFGPKPMRPFRLPVDWNRLKLRLERGVKVLSGADYFLLMLFMRLSSSAPKQDDLCELKSLYPLVKDENFTDSSLFSSVDLNLDLLSVFTSRLLEAPDWYVLQKKCKADLMALLWAAVDSAQRSEQFGNTVLYRMKVLLRKVGRLLSLPAYRIRSKGLLVALVGVDGAGKSTAVETLMSDKYYQLTGVRRVYFGFNEYRIPGVLWANKVMSRIPVFKYVPRLMMIIDRQLRIIPALFYRQRGNLVVCDRYYYDDEISKSLIGSQVGPLSLLKKILKPRMFVIPDLTIYLDVSPEVAYARKQDYPFETMLVINKAYRDYMGEREEVVFINADNPQEVVIEELFLRIKGLEMMH